MEDEPPPATSPVPTTRPHPRRRPCPDGAHPTREGPIVTALRPCLRHTATVWLASCADCTAWHQHRTADDRRRARPVPAAA